MIRKCLLICVYLFAVADVVGQSRIKRVHHPPEVIEAYRVCSEFQRLLAENLDFDRAFEATFTKDPVLRREIAIADGAFGDVDMLEVDDATLISIYKSQMQMMILLAPLLYAGEDDKQNIVFPPQIEEIFERKPPKHLDELRPFTVQLKQDVTVLRAHLDKLTVTHTFVGDKVRALKKYLATPLKPPNHQVKPLTAYSKGHVLPVEAEYYKINDYAVIRERGQMRLIEFKLFSVRW